MQVNVSGNDAVITWAKIDTTIYGDPVKVDAYFVYYCGSVDSVYYFHGYTADTTYTHQYVAQVSDKMFYQVTSYVGSLDLLFDVTTRHPNFKLGELNGLIEKRKQIDERKSSRYDQEKLNFRNRRRK